MNQTTDKHFSYTKNNALLELSKSRLYAAHHNPGTPFPRGLKLSCEAPKDAGGGGRSRTGASPWRLIFHIVHQLKRIFSHLLNYAFRQGLRNHLGL
jgi:hypothetical protein